VTIREIIDQLILMKHATQRGTWMHSLAEDALTYIRAAEDFRIAVEKGMPVDNLARVYFAVTDIANGLEPEPGPEVDLS